ncbi:hypothetical protein Tco_0613455 [Tanacetum coccineum]
MNFSAKSNLGGVHAMSNSSFVGFFLNFHIFSCVFFAPTFNDGLASSRIGSGSSSSFRFRQLGGRLVVGMWLGKTIDVKMLDSRAFEVDMKGEWNAGFEDDWIWLIWVGYGTVVDVFIPDRNSKAGNDELEDNILENSRLCSRQFFVIRAKELIVLANSGLDSSIPFPPGFTSEREFQHVDAQEGFDQMVLETWNNIDLDDKNKMVRFKKKLQILKKEIRSWVNDCKKNQFGRLVDLRSKLCHIDKVIDQGASVGHVGEFPISGDDVVCCVGLVRRNLSGPDGSLLSFSKVSGDTLGSDFCVCWKWGFYRS